MSFGDLKVQDLIYEDSSNNEITVVIADLATKANPVFSGTVTVPTATAGDNSTKAASTAFVVASFAPKNAPAFTGSATGVNLTLSGDLTVNGTTTTINTTTLQVEDKNIEIGKVSSPSDTTADGGGWSLLGATTKTFNWVNATDAWTSSEHIHLGDNKKFLAGTDSDLEMYHTGSGAYIQNKTGNLFIGSNFDDDDGGDIRIQAKYGENSIVALDDGSVELYYDNVKKLETISWGVDCQGNTRTSGDFVCLDNGKFRAGNSSDLQIFHNGSHNYIKCGNDGQDIYIESSKDLYLKTGDGSTGNHTAIYAADNAGVQIKYDNNTKLTTTNTGIDVTGAITVNGSALSAAPEVELTASGSISNNQAVMVQSNGTAKAVAASTAVANPPVANTLNQIWTTDTYQSEICFDSSIDRVVGLFRHQTNGYPWYVVGQPNANGSITWDTPTQLQSTNRTYGKIGSFGNGKVVVVNKPNWGDNEIIYVRIGTVNASNNTISWGSETNVGTGNEPTLEMIDSSYFIVTWRQANASNGMMMKVIQQTGTNGISQGSNQNAGWSDFYMGGNAAEATYNSSTNKCVWAWRSTSNTLRHLIGTVNTSNKTISWGTAGSDPDSGHPNGIDSVWVSDTQFITFFRSNTHSTGRYVVVTISGNNMTSISSPVTFLSSGTAGQPKSEWMSGQSRILLTYKDGSTSDRIRVQIGTFSSGSVTWGTSVLLLGNTGQPEYYGMTPDDEGRAIFLTDDQTGGVSQYSTIVNLTTTSTDADKFIGFSTAAYSNGQTATIAVVGNTSTQSSLTAGLKYYVQKNGTLATTADTPSVEAGIALSSTKLLIKG